MARQKHELDAYEAFRRNLNRLMERHNLTDVEVASELRVHPSHVSRLRRGVIKEPGTGVLAVLAGFFGVTMDKLADADFVRATLEKEYNEKAQRKLRRR